MKITHNNLIIKIDLDLIPTNPREWDNKCKMVFFHKNYNLGDKHNINHKDYNSWDELKNGLNNIYDDIHTILPVYLLDHSGLSISTKDFNDPWDSGQIGFIFITDKTISENKIQEKDINYILENEVVTYNKYLNGLVYSFTITNDKGETLISSGDYYNVENCIDEAKECTEEFV